MIAGLTTEDRICGLKAWIVRALKMQTSIGGMPDPANRHNRSDGHDLIDFTRFVT